MSFIWQSAPDIGRKLERLEGLRDSRLQDILKEAEKVFNKRETQEEKEERLRRETEEREAQRDRKRNRDLSKIMATVVAGQRQSSQKLGERERRAPAVDQDQCAYLSKKLDPVAARWPPCLKMVAAIALLLKDSMKLTLGQPVVVFAPHAVESLVKQPPGRWLSNARMTHYQTLLLDSERITYGSLVVLNLASLLPLPGEPDPHDCLQILAEVHGTRPDLTDQPRTIPGSPMGAASYTTGCERQELQLPPPQR